MTKSKMSVITSALLVGMFAFSGCSNSDFVEGKTFSGVAIDGTLNGSTVTVASTSTTTLTNAVGAWSLSAPVLSNTIVQVTGGVDNSTGENFEGALESVVNLNNTDTVITPVSSLVASLVKTGQTVATAQNTVATQLGVSVAAIVNNPLTTLQSGTQDEKDAAAKVIQSSLIIQKTAEMFAKAATGDAAHKDFNTIALSTMDAIASSLASGTTFTETMDDTTALSATVATQNSELEIDVLADKISAASASAATMVTTISAMDLTALTTATDVTALDTALEQQQKAIEIMSISLEDEMSEVSKATTAADINTSKAEETSLALLMLGGVDGFTVQVKAAQDNGDDLDASDYSTAFLTDDLITAQAATATTLIDAGFTEDSVLVVGEDIATATADGTLDATKTQKILDDAAPDGVVIDTTLVNDVLTSAEDAEKTFTDATREIIEVDGNILTSFGVNDTTYTVSDTGVLDTVTVDKLVGANFAEVSAELDTMFNFDFTLENTQSLDQYAELVTNKEDTLGIYLKNRATNSFVLLSIPVVINIDANGAISFEVPAGALSKMYSKYESSDQYYETSATVDTAWLQSGTLSTGTESYVNIKLGTVLGHFFDQGNLQGDMETILYNVVTRADSYDFSVFLGDNGIEFTNDNEAITLFENLEIPTTSDLSTEIRSDFNLKTTVNDVHGYTGILNVQ